MAEKVKGKPEYKVLATNPQATRRYELHERFEAGLVLLGTEVKAAREGKATIKEAYIGLRGEEAFLRGCHIGDYSNSGYAGHEPTRPRKLLMHKRELRKLIGKLTLRGFTLVPIKLYVKDGRIKLELALGQGKKIHDKREAKEKKMADKEVRKAIADRR